MALHLTIPFPSEAEALRKQLQLEQHWTPTQRLLAVVDAPAAAEAVSQSGMVRDAQLKYHQRLEEEWQKRMKEFIQHHVDS